MSGGGGEGEGEREMGEEKMALKMLDWKETGGGGWKAFSSLKITM